MLYADLHIHGPYSQGTSNNLNFENLTKYARIKGTNLMGTGDAQHPKWLETIKKDLDENLQYKGFQYVLSTEIANIYKQEGKTRKIHSVILFPDVPAVEQFQEALLKKGRIDYDGRPIFGFHVPELVDMVMGIDAKCEVIPAHIWTPWFSLFGSNSGFDRIEDCYDDTLKHIHAYETGLSSDPPMNWRLSQLDDYSAVSFSDLHSFWPWRIGREATLFDFEYSYDKLIHAIRNHGTSGTIEVDPNYGKYHVDGHRKCGVSLTPEQARKYNNICPVCGKLLTIGVLHRVEELADREEGFRPKNAKPFRTLMPLSELISTIAGKGIATKTVWTIYNLLVDGRSELEVMLETPEVELKKLVDEKLVNAIMHNRTGQIEVKPGYDGVYGEPLLEGKATKPINQKTMSEY